MSLDHPLHPFCMQTLINRAGFGKGHTLQPADIVITASDRYDSIQVLIAHGMSQGTLSFTYETIQFPWQCCRTDAQQAHVRTLLAAGRYEEAAESARDLFESCTEAGMQVDGPAHLAFAQQHS